MALQNQNASLCIKLKKSADKTKYHAKLVISSVLIQKNDNNTQGLKNSSKTQMISLTNCVLNVNLQSPEAVPYFTLDIGNFPLSTSLSSRNQKALYLASSLFYPFIKDYAITSNSSHKREFECSIAALFTKQELENFELTEKVNITKRKSISTMRSTNNDQEEDKQELSFSDLNDQYLGALVLSGDYLSNGFQKIKRNLIQIMENDKQSNIFKFDMHQKDFDIINTILHKMSTGNRKINGCFKLNQQQTIFRVQMLYNDFQCVQVQVIGKVSTMHDDDDDNQQIRMKDNIQSSQ